MIIDRIAIDILNWIRRVFHRPERRSQSFQPIVLKRKTSINGKHFAGQLALVVRDTRRATRTWVYMPPRTGVSHADQKDIHICLDTLEKMAQERNEIGGSELAIERSKGNTHRITIFKASHWCGESGAFETDEIFSGYFRFDGVDPNRWAIAALDDLACLVPFLWEKADINWDVEIGLSRIQAWQSKG